MVSCSIYPCMPKAIQITPATAEPLREFLVASKGKFGEFYSSLGSGSTRKEAYSFLFNDSETANKAITFLGKKKDSFIPSSNAAEMTKEGLEKFHFQALG